MNIDHGWNREDGDVANENEISSKASIDQKYSIMKITLVEYKKQLSVMHEDLMKNDWISNKPKPKRTGLLDE